MSLVDALLMSSAVKDKAKNLVCKVPSYAAQAIKPQHPQTASQIDSQKSAA